MGLVPASAKLMSRRFKISLVLIGVLALWVFLAPYLATCLIIEKPLASADAIIVLSGSAVYKERTRKAAELYARGVAPRILLTNDGERSGWLQKEQTNLPFVELERRELLESGVPAEAISVLPGTVAATVDEANAILAELDERPLTSLLIVTSAYHTSRSLWTFEKVLKGRGVEIGIEHAPVGEYSPLPATWWLTPRGWEMVAAEYVKSAAYWAFY